ncbi:MAG: OmpA family protein [Patescibacteria group bacterium]|jgi:outer membrane protein OmpA-like peptidoglycan-associated protein
MFQKIGWATWVAIIVVVGAILIYGSIQYGWLDFIAPGLTTTESQKLEKTNIQKVTVGDKLAGTVNVTMPSTTPVQSNEATTMMVAAWNAQLGAMFANGGVTTTEGSMMAKNGVNLTFQWDDEYSHMQQGLMAHAKACAQGNDFSGQGVTFAAFMGDNYASFAQAINPLIISELGPEYIVEAFDMWGFSYEEDKWLGRPIWKQFPDSARGSLTICVLRDGDQNIILKWAADNDIDVNPDPTTYDPNAINFYPANSCSHAAQLFISGVTEERPVVNHGKRTGKNQTITAEGVATWLPGDQLVVDQRGGVITVASTKDYAGQMPCLVVGIKAFNQRHPEIIKGIIKSADEGAKAIRSNDQARMRGAVISAEVYKQNDGTYWYKYFDGEPRTVEVEGRSYVLSLGGSRVCTLQDVVGYFGMAPNSRDVFKDTYNYFGRLYAKLYPEFIPTYPPYEQVVNLSYILQVKNETNTQASPTMAKYQAGAEITQAVGKKSWGSITFEFGSAQLTSQGEAALEQLASEHSSDFDLKMMFEGNTDNVGDEYKNQLLSEARAKACRDWLFSHYPYNFPISRMNIVGYGEAKPKADNDTPEGRQLNRRVDVITGR